MVNLYKLTNLLEAGMTIFQLNQWKNEGIWYPITQYKKPSNEIEVVTNLFIPIDTETQRYHIQLTANYDASEMDEWKRFLEDNQWKLYPLLKTSWMYSCHIQIMDIESYIPYTRKDSYQYLLKNYLLNHTYPWINKLNQRRTNYDTIKDLS